MPREDGRASQIAGLAAFAAHRVGAFTVEIWGEGVDESTLWTCRSTCAVVAIAGEAGRKRSCNCKGHGRGSRAVEGLMRQSLDDKDTLIERPVNAGVVSFVVDQGRRGVASEGRWGKCGVPELLGGSKCQFPRWGKRGGAEGARIERPSEHSWRFFRCDREEEDTGEIWRRTGEHGPTENEESRRSNGSRECGGDAPCGRPILPGSRSSSPKAVAQRSEHRADARADDTREATKREKNVHETSEMASQPLWMVAGLELWPLASMEGSISSRLGRGRQPSRTVEANACLL